MTLLALFVTVTVIFMNFEAKFMLERFVAFVTFHNNNNFPQSGPALQGCTVNVPVPKAVSS